MNGRETFPLERRAYDIIIWGATGFTGKLIAQHFIANYPPSRGVSFALAGRSQNKLEEVRLACGRFCNRSVAHVAMVVARLDETSSMDQLTASAHVVIAAAGPFDIIGTPVVDACVRTGTHYVDISGETQWVRKIIDKHHDAARQKKIKIVPCCGFDCIPSDMGCYFMVSALKDQHLIPEEVRFILNDASGTFSNGTCSTMLHLFASSSFKQLAALMNPFCLNPKDKNDSLIYPAGGLLKAWRASDKLFPEFESVFKFWTIPYIMQGIDCRLVNRANAINNWVYGEDFVFSERMRVESMFFAIFASLIIPVIAALMLFTPTRVVLSWLIPAPGTGPSLQVQQNGFFKVKLWGRGKDPKTGESVFITGGIDAMKGDPGYLQCSRMVSEAAVCLAQCDSKDLATSIFGVIPPSVAFGDKLLRRLNDVNISFSLNDRIGEKEKQQ